MLTNEKKSELEHYIDSINCELKNLILGYIDLGLPNDVVIDKTIECTVNRYSSESKMILSSVYNHLQDATLYSTEFTTLEKKDAFYKLHILENLNSKLIFEIPRDIKYEKMSQEIKKALIVGAIAVEGIGSVVSIVMKSVIPVSVCTIIAGIMCLILIKNKSTSKNILELIDEYLDAVKSSLLRWISDIEKFYDEQISTL